MENNSKASIRNMLIFAALLAVAFHLDKLTHFFSYFIGITFPLIIGAVMAFVLNVPMRGFEKIIKKLDKKNKMKDGLVLTLSLILTVISAILLITLVIVIMVPGIVSSVKQAYTALREELPSIIKLLAKYGIDAKWVENLVAEKSWQEWISTIGNSAGNVLGKVMSGATSTLSGVGSVGIGIVICAYILLDKRALTRRVGKLLGLIFNEETKDKAMKLGRTIMETYSSFLTGQCVEAFILGAFMFIALTIFGVPYAALIAVLTGVFSFIPFIGPFLACGLGAVMIVITDPIMVLVEIAVFLVVQFIEGQFIYPKVVGDSVGLPPIFTLLAAILGGEMFGVIGMIFSIPMTAVIYTLLRDMAAAKTERRLAAMHVAANDADSDGTTEEELEDIQNTETANTADEEK